MFCLCWHLGPFFRRILQYVIIRKVCASKVSKWDEIQPMGRSPTNLFSDPCLGHLLLRNLPPENCSPALLLPQLPPRLSDRLIPVAPVVLLNSWVIWIAASVSRHSKRSILVQNVVNAGAAERKAGERLLCYTSFLSCFWSATLTHQFLLELHCPIVRVRYHMISFKARFLCSNVLVVYSKLCALLTLHSVVQIHLDLARYHELGRFLPKSVSASKNMNFMFTDENDHSTRGE